MRAWRGSHQVNRFCRYGYCLVGGAYKLKAQSSKLWRCRDARSISKLAPLYELCGAPPLLTPHSSLNPTVYPRPMTLAYMPRCPADPSLEGIQKLCSRKDQKRTNFIVKWMKYTEKGNPGRRFIRIRARKEMDRDSKHPLWMVSKMLKRFEVQGSRFKLWCGAQIKKRRKL